MWGKYQIKYRIKPAPQLDPIEFIMTVLGEDKEDAEVRLRGTFARRLPGCHDSLEILSITLTELLGTED